MVAIGAGLVAGSVALVGVGFDSVIELGSSALTAEARQTEICTWLPTILLGGLLLNALLGW